MHGRGALIGRDAELGLVEELLDDHRLVTVTGPGGVGKTRLAVAVADRRATPTPMIAELDGVPSGSSLEVLCGRLDVESPAALALRLPEGSLLVLDGGEHVTDAVAALVDGLLAASDRLSVLVTAREPVGLPEERLVILAPLEPAAAVALFYERAQAAGAAWTTDATTEATVAELCQRLDALPLAIELAAPRARTLSAADLLSLMDQRLAVLETPSARGPSRSMTAAIETSTALLTPEQVERLHALATLPSPFDAGLAAAVIPGSVLAVADASTELVDRSLLVATPTETATRYRLLELVRDHALAGLREADREVAVREQLTDRLVDEAAALVAEGLEQWSGGVIGRIAARTDALVDAIGWCVDHDREPARALGLFLPLFGGIHQTRSAEIRAAGEQLLERWPEPGPPMHAEVRTIVATGWAVAEDGRRAVELATSAIGDPAATGVAIVLGHRAAMLGWLAQRQPAPALDHAREGEAAAISVPMPPFARELVAFQASLLDRLGRADEAAEVARRAVRESDEAHDHVTELFARLMAATAAARDGRWADVREELDHARQLATMLDAEWRGGSIFRSATMLAICEAAERAMVEGWDASVPWWGRALDRCASRGEATELAMTLHAAARVAFQCGREPLAGTLAGVAVPMRELIVFPTWFGAVPADHVRPALQRPGSLAAAVDQAVAAIAASTSAVAPTPPSGDASDREAALLREADGWSLTFDGSTVRLHDLKGLADLARLVGMPDQEVHCLELMGGADVEPGMTAIDDEARNAYRARILDLQEEIDEAHGANDRHRAERAELELDALVTELSSSLGLGGRGRSTGSSAERARSAVTYRIRAALKKVEAAHPAAGTHLGHSVRTGTWCSYRPEHQVRWSVIT